MEYYSSLAKRRREDDAAANNGQAVPSSVSANAKEEEGEEEITSSDEDEILGQLIYNSSRTAQLWREQQQRQDKAEEEEVLKKKRIRKSFEQRIDDLRAYKEKNGHIKVKKSDDKSLSAFCRDIRYAHNNPEKSNIPINDERISSLDALGFDWSVNTVNIKLFEQQIENLKAYKEKHRHVNVKRSQDKSLYEFCRHMRRARNYPEKSTTLINKERIASLDALGFDWTLRERRAVTAKKSFEQRIEDLKAYKERHGHTNVKSSNDKSLYKFCQKIRYARNNPGKTTTLINDERIESLDALGFNWSIHAATQSFAQRIEDLRSYKEKHGHVNVKGSEDKSFYQFCINMRYARNYPEKSNAVVTDERIASLDDLGFEWSTNFRAKKTHGCI